MDTAWLNALVASPWLFPALLALVVGDAFLVVLPSETVVVALGSISASVGSPNLAAVVAVAALGAMIGDSSCYGIGRLVGSDRWRWQREGRIGRAVSRARETVTTRPAVLIFTARYIPFARIAVNLSAGAAPLGYRRFLPLSVAAGVGWAIYNVGVGFVFGSLLSSAPVIAAVAAVATAMLLGFAVDLVVRRRAAR